MPRKKNNDRKIISLKNIQKQPSFVKFAIDESGINLVCLLYTILKTSAEVRSMYSQEAVVNNQVGLHARPATFFIQKANEFKSSIWVEKEERKVNAKSLLGVLSLGIVKGTTIQLIADGPDEKEAVEALNKMISSDFAE